MDTRRTRYTLTESDAGVVLNPDRVPDAGVIWLHGLGASGHDFVPMVPELDLGGAAIRFIFPHAPERPVTVNGGMPMRAWYDIVALTREGRQDEAGVRESAAYVDTLIGQLEGSGISRRRIVLAGFSQGGAIVLHAGIRQPTPLAGLLALSTYLPLDYTVRAEVTDGGRATPIFMCHGTQDAVVTMELGTTSRDGLRALGFDVDWRQYPMGHQVRIEEVADIGTWLRGRLPATG